MTALVFEAYWRAEGIDWKQKQHSVRLRMQQRIVPGKQSHTFRLQDCVTKLVKNTNSQRLRRESPRMVSETMQPYMQFYLLLQLNIANKHSEQNALQLTFLTVVASYSYIQLCLRSSSEALIDWALYILQMYVVITVWGLYNPRRASISSSTKVQFVSSCVLSMTMSTVACFPLHEASASYSWSRGRFSWRAQES